MQRPAVHTDSCMGPDPLGCRLLLARDPNNNIKQTNKQNFNVRLGKTLDFLPMMPAVSRECFVDTMLDADGQHP